MHQRNHSQMSLQFFFFLGGEGGHKAENYHDMVADLIQSYKAMGVICFS